MTMLLVLPALAPMAATSNMAQSGNSGASVEVIRVHNEPRIKLVRGDLYEPEVLTREQAAHLVESSWASMSSKDCDGSCWCCLLNEAVEEFV